MNKIRRVTIKRSRKERAFILAKAREQVDFVIQQCFPEIKDSGIVKIELYESDHYEMELRKSPQYGYILYISELLSGELFPRETPEQTQSSLGEIQDLMLREFCKIIVPLPTPGEKDVEDLLKIIKEELHSIQKSYVGKSREAKFDIHIIKEQPSLWDSIRLVLINILGIRGVYLFPFLMKAKKPKYFSVKKSVGKDNYDLYISDKVLGFSREAIRGLLLFEYSGLFRMTKWSTTYWPMKALLKAAKYCFPICTAMTITPIIIMGLNAYRQGFLHLIIITLTTVLLQKFANRLWNLHLNEVVEIERLSENNLTETNLHGRNHGKELLSFHQEHFQYHSRYLHPHGRTMKEIMRLISIDEEYNKREPKLSENIEEQRVTER